MRRYTNVNFALVQSLKLRDMNLAITLGLHKHPKLHSLIKQLYVMVIQ